MNEALEWFFNSWFGFAVGLAIAIGCFVWAICLVAAPCANTCDKN